jgi:hypothetical protein
VLFRSLETDTGRVTAFTVAVDVVMTALPHLTQYQAETGLKAATAHWAKGRVAGAGVVAAARAWTDSGQDYDDLASFARNQLNGRALRILRHALDAAQRFRAAHQA